jgi:hypothetical protein
MTAIAEAPKKFLTTDEIVSRAKAGTGGLIAWCIDAAYPAEKTGQDHPRVGRCYAMYTLEDGRWCNIPPRNAKSQGLLAALQLDDHVVEWATAYDDPPRDPEEMPFGLGPAGQQKLMAYRGRLWSYVPTALKDPFEEGVDCEIHDFSMTDVGSVCYYEKKDGVFEMVIG